MEKLNQIMKKRLKDTKRFETIYRDIRKIDYQNLSVEKIWDNVFEVIEQKCISRNYFIPSSNIYIGFTLQQIKHTLFQNILCATTIYAQNLNMQIAITPQNIKYIIHQNYIQNNNMSIMPRQPIKELKKAIRRKKIKTQKCIDYLEDTLKTAKDYDYLINTKLSYINNCEVNLTPATCLSRSLELTHFLYATDYTSPKVFDYISTRFHLDNVKKLSVLISEYLKDPSSIHDCKINYTKENKMYSKNLTLTNNTAVCWDFEDIFHTQYINNIIDLCSKNFPSFNTNEKLDFIYCLASLKTLPPLWLFDKENNMLDLISKYIVTTLNQITDEYIKQFYFMTIDILHLVYHLLETSFVYILSKKYTSPLDLYRETTSLLDHINSDVFKITYKNNRNFNKKECINVVQLMTKEINITNNPISIFKDYIYDNYFNKDNTAPTYYNYIFTQSLLSIWMHTKPCYVEAITRPQSYENRSKTNYEIKHTSIYFYFLCFKNFRRIQCAYLARNQLFRKLYSNFPNTIVLKYVEYDKQHLAPNIIVKLCKQVEK